MTVPGIVHFLCHVPSGMYAVYGMDHYHFVKKNAGILLLPPLSGRVLLSESFAGPGGIALCIWNFLGFTLGFTSKGVLLAFLGFVDAIFVALIATRLLLEESFVGFTNAQCNQVPRNGTTDPNLIFFERAWQTNVTSPDFGREMCKSFMINWYVGLAIAIVYSISTFACFYSVKGEHIWTIIKFPFWAPVKVILWAAWTAFYLLPERVQTAIPYYARYVKKWAFHKKPSSGVKLHVLPSRLATRRRGLDEYAARLARILRKEKTSNYDILQLIAQEVDYVDLINLSLVSKAIRSTMFPSGEDDEDERQLRLNSCAGKIKSTCWVCAIQICQDCSAPRLCRESTVSQHMRLCQGKCTSCFRKSLGWKSMGRQACSCVDGRRASVSALAGYGQVDRHERRLCRGCIALSQEELLALREKRDNAVYKSLAQQPLACSTCAVVLPRTGPRWWVCSKCKLECGEKCHPGWNGKPTV